MRGCISISLFGPAARYALGAIENARLAPCVYPGWTVVVHAERGHYAIPRLQALGAEVVEHDPLPGSGGMFWRFGSIGDTNFTHCIVRDADSRLSDREAAAVNEWVQSGKAVHSIRDHPWHENVALLGGGWGAKTGVIDIAGALSRRQPSGAYGDDETFLHEHVWPQVFPHDILRHTSRVTHEIDVLLPPQEPGDPHFGQQAPWTPDIPIKCVVLSPEKFKRRRERFFENFRASGCFLPEPEWYRGKTTTERVIPSHVDHAEAHPHYYLASRDHIDIIEQAILDGTEYLLVFEDDAVIEPDFNEFFGRMWASLPDDWRGVMLGGAPWTDDAREYVSPETAASLARVRGCLGMHATLWNRDGMRRAFDHFTYWNRMVIDQAFRGLQGDEPRFYAPAKWIVGIDPDAIQFGQDG